MFTKPIKSCARSPPFAKSKPIILLTSLFLPSLSRSMQLLIRPDAASLLLEEQELFIIRLIAENGNSLETCHRYANIIAYVKTGRGGRPGKERVGG